MAPLSVRTWDKSSAFCPLQSDVPPPQFKYGSRKGWKKYQNCLIAMYLLWHRLQDATRRACRRPHRHQPSDLLQLVCSACAHPARKARVSAWLQVKTLMTTPPSPLSPPCGLEEGVKGSTTLPALNWSPGTSTEKRYFIPVTDTPWMSEIFKKGIFHNSSKENASYATLYLNDKLF